MKMFRILNMLVAAKDAKRFIIMQLALPPMEIQRDCQGRGCDRKPLSLRDKYVNELYADIFSKTYGLETIGLRYFNVFGRKQDPNGLRSGNSKFVMQLMNHETITINDFTYIENVIQMNELAMTTENSAALNTV
jgi:UDP-N-acetylglucosamine 4-epimerase